MSGYGEYLWSFMVATMDKSGFLRSPTLSLQLLSMSIKQVNIENNFLKVFCVDREFSAYLSLGNSKKVEQIWDFSNQCACQSDHS